MSVYITSDWHLGHKLAAKLRGFENVEYHDWEIINNMQKILTKRDKLFILGDVAFNEDKLRLLGLITCVKDLIIGNHDKLQTQVYLKYFNKVHGFRRYKDFWLSHCPVHPQELYRVKGNIHGHIHSGAATSNLPTPPYFNVNVDFHELKPVDYDYIKMWFEEN